jgi:hypothetical protein
MRVVGGIVVILGTLYGCATPCEQACTLLYRGGQHNCSFPETPGGPPLGYEETCFAACEETSSLNDRIADERLSVWSECVLANREDIRFESAKYSAPDEVACSVAYEECGDSPCASGLNAPARGGVVPEEACD